MEYHPRPPRRLGWDTSRVRFKPPNPPFRSTEGLGGGTPSSGMGNPRDSTTSSVSGTGVLGLDYSFTPAGPLPTLLLSLPTDPTLSTSPPNPSSTVPLLPHHCPGLDRSDVQRDSSMVLSGVPGGSRPRHRTRSVFHPRETEGTRYRMASRPRGP